LCSGRIGKNVSELASRSVDSLMERKEKERKQKNKKILSKKRTNKETNKKSSWWNDRT
jgi:hypothetical protein